MDNILLSLSRKVVLPDVEMFINLGDWPLVRDPNHLFPIFSWCGSTDSYDIVMPTYDITESSLEIMGRFDAPNFCWTFLSVILLGLCWTCYQFKATSKICGKIEFQKRFGEDETLVARGYAWSNCHESVLIFSMLRLQTFSFSVTNRKNMDQRRIIFRFSAFLTYVIIH